MAASRRCTTCPRLIQHTGRCDQCRGTAHQRGYTAAWRTLAAAILERDAWTCRIGTHCQQTPGQATSVDHITPKAAGGTDEPGNLQAACLACNSAKRDR